MKSKNARHIAIKEVLTQCRLTSLHELSDILKSKGIQASISTLSRDLKELGISGWHGIEADKTGLPKLSYQKMIKTIEVANQLAVIKTYVGFAGSLAAELDKAQLKSLLATLAGDDVLLLIPKDRVTAEAVKDDVKHYFSDEYL